MFLHGMAVSCSILLELAMPPVPSPFMLKGPTGLSHNPLVLCWDAVQQRWTCSVSNIHVRCIKCGSGNVAGCNCTLPFQGNKPLCNSFRIGDQVAEAGATALL